MLGSYTLTDNRLEDATKRGDYEYWLTQEDIADIARLEYLNFRQGNEENSFREFAIIGSPQQLRTQLLTFTVKANHVESARLTMIVNLNQQHWVTLLFASHNKNYVGYYIDSIGNQLPENYLTGLETILAPVVNLSGYYNKQEDVFNCGLWALENAEALTRMIDERKGPHWITHELQRSRGPKYFNERRRSLSIKLSDDPVRQARLGHSGQPISFQETHDELLLPLPVSNSATVDTPNQKKRVFTEAEKVTEKQDLFVKLFIQAFAMRLAAFSLIAKGNRLSIEGLNAELKTGFVGALWGVTITQNFAGSIPSVVATVRSVSARYFIRTKKGQKITRAFSEVNGDELSECLAQTAIEIFQSYEQQFMQISDKAGHYNALEKLADDAAGRALNYLDATLTPTTTISSEMITLGILKGKSEIYFDPSLKKTRIRYTGNHIQDAKGHSFSTANLFEKVGVIIKSNNGGPNKYYKKNIPQSTIYGYRRPLSWETDSTGALKASELSNFISETPSNLIPYDYQLNSNNIQLEAIRVLERISNPKVITTRKNASPKNIIFNLRHPLKNFSGRTQALIDLHRLLNSDSKSAVVTHMEQLSLHSVGRPGQLSQGTQAAVSGLGGIGKTQLALQYAKQHAADYDHNVLWIDSERKTDIVNSFRKLAMKLAIDLNSDGNEKEISQLIADIYAHFATTKSLFIFDNVENAKEMVDILPQVSNGNKPTVLITSRYTNWKNIAMPLQLDVFSETEARTFIKIELSIRDNTENLQIAELTNLLQSLPLALQQAVAYILSEKILDRRFSIQNYIDRFKQKQSSQELLEFDLSRFNNDPYSRTILTTWEVTLDKIKKEKIIGEKAIETLQIMAYLYPDNIANNIFLSLPNSARLGSAIHLLKAYSLINVGSQPDISSIHRLVQKVLRIKLENNPKEFKRIVQKIVYLTADFTKSKESMSHYFSFLLHMLEHTELARSLDLSVNQRKILESLVYFEKDTNLVKELFDFAYASLSRKNYLEFIGEALVIYMRYPIIISLNNVLDYVDQKINEGLISLDETKLILDFKYKITRKNYKDLRFSAIPAQKAMQFKAIAIVFDFEHKYFSKEAARFCNQDRKRRSVNTLCSLAKEEPLLEYPLDTQQIKAYIKKIHSVANLANLAFLGKDTLSALIQGDFESVAINFSLLSSSQIFGKLSNKLLIKEGTQLALSDEKLLLQKELDYDGKLAASLFTDKAIMLAGKRRFLGKMMIAAAPFIARGTSLFFAYNFAKGISNNQTDWLDNLSNGAIVALDMGESGIEAAEYLGYLIGVSEVTGPIGESLALLAVTGIQLYHVEKELMMIEKWVHLSSREKFVEGIRAFFNFRPSEYLEKKANNEQLANRAINFLKLHSEIQYYLFSTGLSHNNLSSNNFVFLDRRRNIVIDRDTVPERPTLSDFFCLEGMRPPAYANDRSWIEEKFDSLVDTALEEISNLEEKNSFLCINTSGIEYPVNRTNNITLVALEGNASVIGPDSTTIYVINDGNHTYIAGDEDDLFILRGTRATGKLQGSLGVNIVKFSDYQPNAESVLLDPQGFLCGKNATTTSREEFFVGDSQLSNITQLHTRFPFVEITVVNKNGSAYTQLPFDKTTYSLFYKEVCIEGLQLSNITQIHGRKKKQDKVFSTTGITIVDTYEGENAIKPDYIYITEKSSKNLKIIVRPNTVIHSLPRDTRSNLVSYKVPADQAGKAFIQLPFNDNTIHQFYFESNLENFEALSIKINTISFKFSYPDGDFNVTIQNTEALHFSNTTTTKPLFIQNASYILNKSLEIKLINKKTLYAQWHGNNSINEIIQLVAPMAHRIDKAMVIQTPQNETIAIGGRQQEILSTDGLVVNHLVGNAGDAVYVIQIPKNTMDPFPLNDISLYNLENENNLITMTTDTLDLREVIKKAREQCSTLSILPIISENQEGVILTLYANYYFSESMGCAPLGQNSYPLLKLLLKLAWDNLDINLDGHPMNIIYDEEGKLKLAPIPLAFTGNKNIITITDTDIKKNDEIIILKNLGQYEFMRHNTTDLLLTNLFSNVTATELYTVLFSNFFQKTLFKEKVLSLRLSFLDDESLSLSRHVQEINNATDFYLFIKSYFNISHVLFNSSGIFFTDATTPSASRKRRNVKIPLSISSSSSSIIPSIYNLFTYLPLQVLQLIRLLPNKLKTINKFEAQYRTKEESAECKKTKYVTLPLKEKINIPVYCNKNDIFFESNCWKNQSRLGLLGYCVNSKQVIAWFIKNIGTTSQKLSWFAITGKNITANTNLNHLPFQESSLSLQAEYLHFSPKDGCHQVIKLDKMSNATLTTLFSYLPLEGKQWLLAQWRYEKNIQDKQSQDAIAISLFKQQSLQVGLNYVGNAVLLHSFIGDFFHVLGLQPNWREYDPSYFLARWLSTIQQLRVGETNQTSTIAAALLETALLHPKIQIAYSVWQPNIKIRYKKQALRFCADLLQWGNLKFALLPSLLEILFAGYLPIESIIWSLRAALSFYSINNDLSYYYLGIVLFLLPQLPFFLEHLGIPVTTYVHKALEKLTQLFISQSLLEQLKPTPDQSRLAQQSIELQAAGQRTIKAHARITTVVKPLISFFKLSSINRSSVNPSANETYYKTTYVNDCNVGP